MDPLFLFTLIVLIFSIIIHEVAHGYAANYLGDPTARLQGRLTLNPVSHIDPIGSVLLPGILLLTHSPFLFGWAKPVPYNPHNLRNARWGEAFVAFAGPGINIVIALVFAAVIRLAGPLSLSDAFLQLSLQVVSINILLALFNMIPFPPLDGSKVLKALLPGHLAFSYEQFERGMMQLGLVGLVIFLIIFSQFFSGPFAHFMNLVVRTLIGV